MGGANVVSVSTAKCEGILRGWYGSEIGEFGTEEISPSQISKDKD